ncbi:MAG TPA: hypothetical protein VGO18_08540 [Steroidobacteraceae bacterium]|jgi:hypothetical protein|nr:hypothetical protein [Steroidobacteraceae bacterium]
MNRAPIAAVVRTAAVVASIAITLVLFSAVVSLSEPQQSQLIAATASRQMATQRKNVLVVQSKPVRPTLVAQVAAR